MTLEIWIAYVVATTVLLMIPGPTVLLVTGYAISGGGRTGWWTVPGVVLGDAVAMVASLAGLGALLAASASAFAVLKWVGAAYLVFLGIRMWRAEPTIDDEQNREDIGRWALTAHAFYVTALNPKSIAFFVAFMPQFVARSAPIIPQLLILGLTFLALAFVNISAYAALAAAMRKQMRSPGLVRAMNRAGGSILIGASIMTAALRRVS